MGLQRKKSLVIPKKQGPLTVKARRKKTELGAKGHFGTEVPKKLKQHKPPNDKFRRHVFVWVLFRL